MFASKTGRDFNTDPEPWEARNGYRYAEFNEGEAMFGGIRFAPRDEFDKPMHNEPNPILVEFRDVVDGMPAHLARKEVSWWLTCLSERAEFYEGKPEYKGWNESNITHARKVLERLARA